jgi:acetoin utilization deacetylase AcuC-like enzyme
MRWGASVALRRIDASMLAFYSDRYVLPLPAGHRFPMAKYGKLRQRVATELPGVELREPVAATDGELALAHTPDYIERVTLGRLTSLEVRTIGFPWSPAMVERSRRSTGATIGACRAALQGGVAVNLAGGTHHAHADQGQGYCVFNDAAVAARLMQAEASRAGRHLRVAIIDLDVHQGNGTATILQHDPSIYTLSLHGATNFPFRKATSRLDVHLPDGTGDTDYLAALDAALDRLAREFSAQLLIYLAGADAHEGDRLGKLRLSTAGMAARDARVLDFAARHGVPLAVAMAGGYGRDIDVTVDVHLNTVRAALAHHLRSASAALPA